LHLSVIIATLDRLETARLIAARVRTLLPTLELEVIVVTPSAETLQAPMGYLRYVSDPRRGVYAAYKAGMRQAIGQYVWFIGDDDYPLDAAARIAPIMRENSVDLLIAPVLFSSGRLYRPTRSLLLLHFLNWCQQGVIYRRRVLLGHRFFRRLTVQADQYVNILLRADATISKSYLADPICLFGVGGVSGKTRDEGYRSVRLALAHRTLGCVGFSAFRVLTLVQPLAKRVMKIR
jgi:glycosyltransferase involved in cell wall biosynthesis